MKKITIDLSTKKHLKITAQDSKVYLKDTIFTISQYGITADGYLYYLNHNVYSYNYFTYKTQKKNIFSM